MAKEKRKFDVWPSAYSSGWLVKTYKSRGGKYKAATGGEVTLKPVPEKNKGLGKLPPKVRNQMGYMFRGGTVNKNSTMVQGRGCGVIDPSKQKKTRVPRT